MERLQWGTTAVCKQENLSSDPSQHPCEKARCGYAHLLTLALGLVVETGGLLWLDAASLVKKKSELLIQ